MPISGPPDGHNRRDLREFACLTILQARQDRFEYEAMAMSKAGEVVDHFNMRLEPGLGGFLGVELEIIYAADTVQQLEPQAGIVTKESTHFDQTGRFDDNVR